MPAFASAGVPGVQVAPQALGEGGEAATPAERKVHFVHHGPVRLSWARLLKRLFDIDLVLCPKGGGELKVTLEILEVRQGLLALVAGHREDPDSPGL